MSGYYGSRKRALSGARYGYRPSRRARFGPSVRRQTMRRAGTLGRYPLRRGSGYTRRVGMYGRFGTGRSNNAQIEKKFFDTSIGLPAGGNAVSASNSQGAILVGIAQGTGASQRIGQKIIVKSIQLKLQAVLASGAVDADIMHVYLWQDTQTNGAYPALTDIYANSGPIGTNLRTMEESARFKLLKHFVFQLNSDAGVATAFGGDIRQDECYLKCNIPIVFNSSTGAIGEIKSNNLIMTFGSSNSTATVSGNARVRYTDR